MERRVSLSLGRKCKQRNLAKSHDTSLNNSISRSPSASSTGSDHGIECSTPQHKHANLDDSFEYSPKTFDRSFSPTTLLSQTLAIDSPEVGWKWSRTKHGSENTSDLSNRAGICVSPLVHSRTERDSRAKASLRYNSKKEAIDFEIRRAKKSRADALLKMRCEKFQKQLNDVKQESRLKCNDNNENEQQNKKIKSTVQENSTRRKNESPTTSPQIIHPINSGQIESSLLNDTLDGFLNDSEMDGVLLAATQQIESDIVGTSVKTPLKAQELNNDSTPNKHSLYMQLLEDDLDWFTSMDDFVQQDVDVKRPRKSFQRYKSMPTDTVSAVGMQDEITVANVDDKKYSTKNTNSGNSGHNEHIDRHTTNNSSPVGIIPTKLRRRLSTQALSPHDSRNVYNRQFRLRK